MECALRCVGLLFRTLICNYVRICIPFQSMLPDSQIKQNGIYNSQIHMQTVSLKKE